MDAARLADADMEDERAELDAFVVLLLAGVDGCDREPLLEDDVLSDDFAPSLFSSKAGAAADLESSEPAAWSAKVESSGA